MRLVTAILAKNEASEERYLRRVITRCLAFSDVVVLLDDRSTDQTPHIAKEMGCIVRTRETLDAAAWGKEASARRELWEFACEYAVGIDDWVLICDADQVMVGDVRSLCYSQAVNAWCFTLFDLWSETEYREDELWVGHKVHRPWLFAPNRVPEGWVAEWGTRGIHVGHCPVNFPMLAGNAPPEFFHWLHYGYSREAHRLLKYQQYAATFDQLTPFERRHAESILQ